MDRIPAGRKSDSADVAPASVKDGCDAMRAKGIQEKRMGMIGRRQACRAGYERLYSVSVK